MLGRSSQGTGAFYVMIYAALAAVCRIAAHWVMPDVSKASGGAATTCLTPRSSTEASNASTHRSGHAPDLVEHVHVSAFAHPGAVPHQSGTVPSVHAFRLIGTKRHISPSRTTDPAKVLN